MKFDVYFHDDFDGRASVAVFLNFLKSQGDEIENFYPVNHWMAPTWDRMVRKSKNPVAIFDFYFHPKATFFFDHHATTFINKDWEKNFKPTKYYNLNFNSKSCASLTTKVLKKYFKYKVPESILDLAFWSDVVDGAEYASAKETIELKRPGLQLDAFIEGSSGGKNTLEWLIRMMSEEKIGAIVRLPRIQAILKKERQLIEKGVRYTQKHLQVYEQVAFLDLTGTKIPRVRFAPHYLYPNLVFVITLMKESNRFRISVGANPWGGKKSKIDLGGHLKFKYGGGGHKNAAGIAGLKSKEEGIKISRELIDFLKNK